MAGVHASTRDASTRTGCTLSAILSSTAPRRGPSSTSGLSARSPWRRACMRQCARRRRMRCPLLASRTCSCTNASALRSAPCCRRGGWTLGGRGCGGCGAVRVVPVLVPVPVLVVAGVVWALVASLVLWFCTPRASWSCRPSSASARTCPMCRVARHQGHSAYYDYLRCVTRQ